MAARESSSSHGVLCSYSMHPVRLPPCRADLHDPADNNEHRTGDAGSACDVGSLPNALPHD